MQAATSEIICDACGCAASDAHLARRNRRLEWATRFRPIHIQILFVAESAPLRDEDFFYCPNADRALRQGPPRLLFDELMQAAGIAPDAAEGDEALLAEFQRRNFFFTYGLECPAEEVAPQLGGSPESALRQAMASRFGPLLARRIALSYKPKHVVLLTSTQLSPLAPLLQALQLPSPLDLAAAAAFRSGIADVLKRITPSS